MEVGEVMVDWLGMEKEDLTKMLVMVWVMEVGKKDVWDR